jgi:hypothetical protein
MSAQCSPARLSKLNAYVFDREAGYCRMLADR